MDIDFVNLSETPLESVLMAFKEAFADYAVNFDEQEIKLMLKRRGYEPSLSFAARADGKIVSFILNGYGTYDGKKTCYDCGTGTVKAFRGRGIAGELFRESLPTLKANGVEQYVLEVLTTNEAAIKVYRKSGFEITAFYDCYRQRRDSLIIDCPLDLSIRIEPTGADFIERHAEFCDFTPSWQNSLESIKRAGSDLVIHKAVYSDVPVGYCVLDPLTGDLAQIAVAHQYRRKGVASALLRSLVDEAHSETLKMLNVDRSCESLSAFLRAVGFEKGLSQYAMGKHIEP